MNNYYFNGHNDVDFSSRYERSDVMKRRENFHNTLKQVMYPHSFSIYSQAQVEELVIEVQWANEPRATNALFGVGN